MRLLRLITRHLVAKVFLAIGLGIGIALLVQTYVDAAREADTLKSETRKWAENIAQLFIGAVEHSMREGNRLAVQRSIEDLRDAVQNSADVRIYDQRGIEVFGNKPPPPAPDELPRELAAILQNPERQVGDTGRIFRPILNERRCHECHDENSRLRGVLEIDLDPDHLGDNPGAHLPGAHLDDGPGDGRKQTFSRIITSGFIHIMTAEHEELLDRYFAELRENSSSIQSVAVFDRDGDIRYGQEIAGLEPATVQGLMNPGSSDQFQLVGEQMVALVPLPMQERCVMCHEDDQIGSVRGVLAVALDAPGSDERWAQRELERMIETSLRYIMLSQLGRRIGDFLDAVSTTDAVRELVLYDNVGRRYWTTTHPTPPMNVAEVLETREPHVRYLDQGMKGTLLAVAPLHNSKECVRCHGADSELRGAVSVEVSTAIAEMTRESSIRRRTWFTAATLLGILVFLGILLQFLIARPVQHIGDVADEIGEGNLGARVARADPEGDEIARLGVRINEMVVGLRTKMNLEKFVSRGAAQAAAGAGLSPMERRSERRRVTVLFSDIRGFTAYSEKVAPEVVVDMLNRLLQAQAEIVVEFGGDIDKYVGDELMAVFTGEDAEKRAVQCAVRMIAAVRDARKEGESLSVGVGISCGDVVYGAIGHEDRLDFTVIGDVVNTGARLCSAATHDEVVISTAVRDAAGEIDGLEFAAGKPLALKGKREPFPVFKVQPS